MAYTIEEKRAKHAEYMREYYRNPENNAKHRAAMKARYREDIEASRAKGRERSRIERLLNPDAQKARRKKFGDNHREELRKQCLNYSHSKRGKAVRQAYYIKNYWLRRHINTYKKMERKGVPVIDKASLREFYKAIFTRDVFHCCYCLSVVSTKTIVMDHKTPISLGGVHAVHNLAPCCPTCNTKKGIKTEIEFLNHN